MPETKISRLQQEILIVNGKTVSVEGGAVVNSYDLSSDEFLDVLKYIDINRYFVMTESANIEIELNKKK